MSADKKEKRAERKRKKLLAEYELASSNDAVSRPGELLDAEPKVKKEKIEDESGGPVPRLSDEDFKKLKKQLAERKKFLTQLPRFTLQHAGIGASFGTNYDDRIPLLMSDIQHLLVYSLCGNSFTTPPSRWSHVEKPNRLTNIVALVVDGITSLDFIDNEHLFPNLTTNFPDRVEVQAPFHYGSNSSIEFSSFPVTHAQKERILNRMGSLEAAVHSRQLMKSFRPFFPIVFKNSSEIASEQPVEGKIPHIGLPHTDVFPRTYLLLNTHQMLLENFPLPIRGQDYNDDGYMMTRTEYSEATEQSPMFALDCEMCLTTAQKLELTHIAVVDENLEVVYETHVKPYNRIINYLTQYSGITKQTLEGVETRLEDVQKAIRELLPADAILVGHSLNNDLMAMKVAHPYIIDTSVIYNLTGERKRKSKLALLTKAFLGETIQAHKSGHSPSEDAEAALKLVQLKLSQGFNFGDSVNIDEGNNKKSSTSTACQFSLSIFNNTGKAQKTVAVVGSKQALKTYERFQLLDDVDQSCFNLIHAKTPKEAVVKMEGAAVSHNFTITHIDVSKKLLKCETLEQREKVLQKVDKWCDRLTSHVSLNGLAVVVFAGPTVLPSRKGLDSSKCAKNKISNNNSNSLGIKPVKGNEIIAAEKNLLHAVEKSSDNDSTKAEETETGRVKVRRLNGAAFLRIKSPHHKKST